MPSRQLAAASFAVLAALAVAAYNIDLLVGAGAPLPDSYVAPNGEDLEQPSACGPIPPNSIDTRLTYTLLHLESAQSDAILYIAAADRGDAMYQNRTSYGVGHGTSSPGEVGSNVMLVVQNRMPTEIRVIRDGPHLLLCSDDPRSEVIALRQYCAGTDDGASWNDGIEEIRFPQAQEIWLQDELLEALPARPSADTRASAEISDERIPLPLIKLNRDRWTLRPFSEVLPGDWFSSIQCRLHTSRQPEG